MSTDINGVGDCWEVMADLSGLAMRRLSLQEQFEEMFDCLAALPWLRIARRGAILLVNSHDELVRVACLGFTERRAAHCERVSMTRCGCGEAAVSGKMICRPCEGDAALNEAEAGSDATHFILPLADGERTMGVAAIYVQPGHVPSAEEKRFMSALGRVLSGVVSRELMEEKLQVRELELDEKQAEIIRKLGAASEYRDTETGMHVMRMSHFAGAIAKAMGMPGDERERMVMAAAMHDVGKIGIPDVILLKPGKLDDLEFMAMTQHTSIGGDLLEGEDVLMRVAREIAITHHEKWDGNGYPQRLKGEEIPLNGRICAVADVFDALTSKRPYKEPWPVEKAIGYIASESGKSFDPGVVAAFEKAAPEILRIRELYRDSIINPNDVVSLPPMPQRDNAWIAWDKSIEIGISVIDEHHRYLVDLTNDLYSAVHDRRGSREIGRVLRALERYAMVHFREEERMMRFYDYAEVDRHAAMHQAFSGRIREFWREFHQSPLTLGFEAVFFLRDWLVGHIKKEDAKLHTLLAG